MRIANEILMYLRGAKKFSMDLSINEPIETDRNGNTLTLIDTIASDESILDKIDNKINVEKLNKYINEKLSPRERMIIVLRYGLDGKRELPQREVASKLGISRSYVSRIEKKAISILRKNF